MSKDCVGRHVCEPPRWPANIEDAWTCPECLALHRPFRVGDSPFIMRMQGVDPDSFGWKMQRA